MINCLVTGVAGFIGSHLARRLLNDGCHVTGIDCFTDYYLREIKEQNLQNILGDRRFDFVEADILNIDLTKLLANIDYIFHEAAQAGVRSSWGSNFEVYIRNNILATQTLLEGAKDFGIKKFIYASSSSIYGDAESYPTTEDIIPKPVSPYGVTKLAGEHLCMLYWKSFRLPTIVLRYFTVYGPGQRPDMAFNGFINKTLENKPIKVYGDGEQTRDFTFVADIVEANLLAAKTDIVGEVFNIGGGSRITLNEVIALLEISINDKVRIEHVAEQNGDVRHTAADITKANKLLGYKPNIEFQEGLKLQIEWMRKIHRKSSTGNA